MSLSACIYLTLLLLISLAGDSLLFFLFLPTLSALSPGGQVFPLCSSFHFIISSLSHQGHSTSPHLSLAPTMRLPSGAQCVAICVATLTDFLGNYSSSSLSYTHDRTSSAPQSLTMNIIVQLCFFILFYFIPKPIHLFSDFHM